MDGSSSNFDKWAGILALIFGAVALVFSWQANKNAEAANQLALEANDIARTQLAAKIEITSLWGTGGGGGTGNEEGGMDAYCVSMVQLTNTGGASTAIIGFDSSVSYLDERIDLESYWANEARSDEEKILDALHSFHVTLVPTVVEGEWISGDVIRSGLPHVEMPLQIDSNETINLTFVVQYKSDPEFGSGRFTYQSDDYFDSRKHPMQMAYEIFLADGGIVSVPRTDCQWFIPNN